MTLLVTGAFAQHALADLSNTHSTLSVTREPTGLLVHGDAAALRALHDTLAVAWGDNVGLTLDGDDATALDAPAFAVDAPTAAAAPEELDDLTQPEEPFGIVLASNDLAPTSPKGIAAAVVRFQAHLRGQCQVEAVRASGAVTLAGTARPSALDRALRAAVEHTDIAVFRTVDSDEPEVEAASAEGESETTE